MASEKTELETMIEAEAKELKESPVIKPIVGQAKRCHICGAVYSPNDLKRFDTHIPNSQPREACQNCHPDRGIL